MAAFNIAALLQNDIIVKFEPGELIIQEGTPGTEMYFILAGLVEIYKKVDEWEAVLETMSDGEIFGESALLENLSHNYSVRAKGSTILLKINKEKLEKIIFQQPELVFTFFKRLGTNLRRKNEELLNYRTKKKTAASPKKKQGKEVQMPEINLTVKGYGQENANNPERFLYHKNITCPICNGSFTAEAIRYSKLSLEKNAPDLRKIYKDFEPLWYLNWVCPYCFYADVQKDFCKVSAKDQAAAEYLIKVLKDKIAFSFSNPRKVEEVLQSYHLALLFTEDNLKKGQNWLRLSWLYEDLQDREMYRRAVGEALNYFQEAYYQNSTPLMISTEQQICYILGDLYCKEGEYDEGRRHFFKAIVHKGGSPVLNRQAEIRIDDIKGISKK
ncbi:MAG: DUF2225 domain-containing protein [Peptococcaceae bacterium]